MLLVQLLRLQLVPAVVAVVVVVLEVVLTGGSAVIVSSLLHHLSNKRFHQWKIQSGGKTQNFGRRFVNCYNLFLIGKIIN